MRRAFSFRCVNPAAPAAISAKARPARIISGTGIEEASVVPWPSTYGIGPSSRGPVSDSTSGSTGVTVRVGAFALGGEPEVPWSERSRTERCRAPPMISGALE